MLQSDLGHSRAALIASAITAGATAAAAAVRTAEAATAVSIRTLTVTATVVHGESDWGSGSSGHCWVATEHGDAGSVLGATQGHHVLADVGGDNLAALRVGVREDVLDEVIAKLVTRDCSVVSVHLRQIASHLNKLTVDQRHARTVRARLADTVQIAIKKLVATNLQALFDHLGGELVHAVLGGKAKDMVDSASAVRGVSMLADVLDAPVAKLTMSDDIDAGQDLVDAGTLCIKSE